MNERLEIASRLLASYPTLTQMSFIRDTLDVADALIALEKQTRPKEAKEQGESFNTAACHVKKGQLLQVGDNFIEIVHIDYNNTNKVFCFYLENNTSPHFKHNAEVTIKNKDA
jgi:hypothetical protein